jgi:hypothetical protein
MTSLAVGFSEGIGRSSSTTYDTGPRGSPCEDPFTVGGKKSGACRDCRRLAEIYTGPVRRFAPALHIFFMTDQMYLHSSELEPERRTG